MRAALAALLLLFSCAALAQPKEHEVKAAFLFKFPSFVEWPQEALRDDAPIVIGVAGADDVVAELQQIVPGRNVQGRPVIVRRLREGEPLAGLHMVFLGRGEAARLREIVRLAPTQPLFVVCDWDGALEQGAVVNFLRGDGRVRFEVALDAAERRNLRISPRMLSVAQSVKPGRL
jgi:hypothetical protein